MRAVALCMPLPSCMTGIPAILFLGGHLAVGQQVAVGVVGGVRTTGDSSGSLTSESKRYIVGPMVEIRLPLRLSFEVDSAVPAVRLHRIREPRRLGKLNHARTS